MSEERDLDDLVIRPNDCLKCLDKDEHLAAKDREIKRLRAWIGDVVRDRCAIKDCPNKPSEGRFVGTLCAPCSETNYRTEIKELRKEVARLKETLERVYDVASRYESRHDRDPERRELWRELKLAFVSPAQPAKEDK